MPKVVACDKAALRRFLGMVQYLATFLSNLSEISVPHEKNLLEVYFGTRKLECKRVLRCNTPVLRFFDINKDVILSVDASSEGLGAVILQEGHPVTYGSRSLTDVQIEKKKKLLDIVYGCVNLQSDHKPLEYSKSL